MSFRVPCCGAFGLQGSGFRVYVGFVSFRDLGFRVKGE